MILLIPAYEPGAHLTALVRDARASDPDLDVLVVDDGSGPAFADVFEAAREAGARVLTHPTNRGKGAALKTGFGEVLDRWPGEDVVTADADGQHTVADIRSVADALREDGAAGRTGLVLGCRDFSGTVPLRSRVGNAISRGLFRVAAGWQVSDTQTGLRGFAAGMLPWLTTVPGDRFEYETEMLLRLRGAGFSAREVPIETVYLERNASSHFRPIVDSLRVSVPLVLFAGSSFLAFLIDTVAVLALSALLSPWIAGWLVVSIVVARLISATVNFAVNRRFVFRHVGRRHAVVHAARYAFVATALLASNVVWMQALTDWGLPLIVAKVATEAVLFVTSYQAQRRFVFAPRERDAVAARSSTDSAFSATAQSERIATP